MKTIWKFSITITDRFFLDLPDNFKVLKVAKQWMWVEGSFDDPENFRAVAFAVIGTGHPIPPGFDYSGTFFADPFVWHVYHWRVS